MLTVQSESFSSQRILFKRILLKSTICDRNQCKCMGRTEQIEKRRTHHGGNQPNRDQKIPLSHCFSFIWCAAGALGIARFEKVLFLETGERIFLHRFSMHVWEAVAQTVRVSALQLARRPAHRTKPIGEEETILEKVIVARQPILVIRTKHYFLNPIINLL